MRLYAGSTEEFISDSVHNRIADRLSSAYFAAYRTQPTPSELNSWRNSLRALSQVFQAGRFFGNGVLLEYELPLTSKRLDCMITGRDNLHNDQAAVIELKQWEQCEEGDGDSVVTFMRGQLRDVLHPSVQVGQYRRYLADFHPAFYEGESPIGLRACSYLHNYKRNESDVLFHPKYAKHFLDCPVFTADDVAALTHYLRETIINPDEQHTLRRIASGSYRPSKKLLEHVGRVLDGKPEYVLLDEQLVAFERVMAVARDLKNQRKKSIVVVRGGPGTGKSVIALNLLAKLSAEGLNTHYVTGSKAFTATLRKIVGTRVDAQVKNFSGYMRAEHDVVDVMVCDEAHRMWEESWVMYRPKTGLKQIEELLNASRALVFFVDDRQAVRPNEIGTAEYIQEFAKERGCQFFDYRLEAQFRCAGSDGFVRWVENTWELERTANVLWSESEKFKFQIVDSPDALERIVLEKAEEGASARLVAGFCWEWSKPLADGSLAPDVQIDGYARPWNARPDAGRLQKGIPKAPLWAYDARGIAQIGCVYTAQGFEFDYVGVIVGPDLVYRTGRGWVGQPEHSFDGPVKRAKGDFTTLVKNTYRVLFSRAMKGCYVYFTDKETEIFVRSRIESSSVQS